ncbi:MAG TPA: sigma-70 family RNA polymerase sigma factor [Bryobacteraceae bacterium]|jgi:RNA polymerase sigma-70 factor (ECF subfamily)|nr:sigma-70 family RNA polymerase sigma factor [Bryobacteraceae bacterium]
MEPEGIALRMTAWRREITGDVAAFERIMSQCERRVLRVALRLLNNPQDAQDAAQEVFLRLYKHLGRLDQTRGYEPWLYGVTVNVCRDIGRARRRSVALADVPDPVSAQPDAYHHAERAQQREFIRRGLSCLGEKERAALVLRDVEGLSTEEVAGILGTSENTVRSQISTARLKLRDFTGRMTKKR